MANDKTRSKRGPRQERVNDMRTYSKVSARTWWAAMVPRPQRQGIQQSADMLQHMSTLLKLEKQYLLQLI
jgi:hypothetical protein